MTEKLFYEDSHMRTFTAQVIRCVPQGERFQVILNRTAFFPEGGGQYADTGRLEPLSRREETGGKESTVLEEDRRMREIQKDPGAPGIKRTAEEFRVLDVQESEGEILHLMDHPMDAGITVRGTIDWQERFMKMQQHTGEHIVSGLIHAGFGYQNVGFHLGSEDCTMDFNGELTRQELLGIERLANQAVTENLEVQVSYPSKEEQQGLEYRSKKEVEGPLRIVTIPGYDVCACCAPHVKRTGEVGLIKLTNVQRYKGGARVTMLCGFRALADYENKAVSVRTISAALCARETEVSEAVEHLKEECAGYKQRLLEQQRKLLTYQAKETDSQGEIVCMFPDGLEGDAPRTLMNLVLERGHLVCAVFCADAQGGYRYVIGSQAVNMRELGKELHVAFKGKGGGRTDMIQGFLRGNEEDLRVWIQEKVRKQKNE